MDVDRARRRVCQVVADHVEQMREDSAMLVDVNVDERREIDPIRLRSEERDWRFPTVSFVLKLSPRT